MHILYNGTGPRFRKLVATQAFLWLAVSHRMSRRSGSVCPVIGPATSSDALEEEWHRSCGSWSSWSSAQSPSLSGPIPAGWMRKVIPSSALSLPSIHPPILLLLFLPCASSSFCFSASIGRLRQAKTAWATENQMRALLEGPQDYSSSAFEVGEVPLDASNFA
jgi:hypothetical protein